MPVLAPISGMPQFRNGRLVTDAVAYFYNAGTTTDRTVYEAASGSAHEQPVAVTGAGNFPAIYVTGTSAYKIRIEDGDGVLIIEYDELSAESEAPAASVGGTTIPTGFEMPAYTTGVITDWVRENGRTIGSASSGATERANADTEDLFLHLWAIDSNLAVGGGRGASAAADWAANKTIALPDARGRVLVGLDDMGNTAASRLTGGLFAFGTATTLGSYGGLDTHTLTTGQLATHAHSGVVVGLQGGADIQGGNTYSVQTGSTANAGSGNAHNNMQPFSLRTIYIKL